MVNEKKLLLERNDLENIGIQGENFSKRRNYEMMRLR